MKKVVKPLSKKIGEYYHISDVDTVEDITRNIEQNFLDLYEKTPYIKNRLVILICIWIVKFQNIIPHEYHFCGSYGFCEGCCDYQKDGYYLTHQFIFPYGICEQFTLKLSNSPDTPIDKLLLDIFNMDLDCSNVGVKSARKI